MKNALGDESSESQSGSSVQDVRLGLSNDQLLPSMAQQEARCQ
jgi:hypothetical protein